MEEEDDQDTDVDMEANIVAERVLLEGLIREDRGDAYVVEREESRPYDAHDAREVIGNTDSPEQIGVIDIQSNETDSLVERTNEEPEAVHQDSENQHQGLQGIPLSNVNPNSEDVVTDSNYISDEEAADHRVEEACGESQNKANMSIDDDDGQTCSICLETWTISGEHRLSSLKCGHLFGNSCILRWLKQTPAQNRACPSCKAKANLKDIRFIFARKVITADTTQEEMLKQQLEQVKCERARLQNELTIMTTNQRMFAIKIAELQKEIASLKERSDLIKVQKRLTNWRYTMHCNTEICKNSSCRVLAYNSRNNCLYVSLMSTNSLFPGYALRKITCDNWTLNKLLYLHPKVIRDAVYSSPNDLLMTVGLDKSIKLVQGANDMITTTIQTPMPLWSCCWDSSNTNRLWVGGAGGIICEYDIRQPRTALSHVTSPDVSPVASLASVSGGFIACRLNTAAAYRKLGEVIHSTPLPVEGTFTCVRSDSVTNDILVSCRPSSNHSRSRHIFCKSDVENFEFHPYVTFEGSVNVPIMSRSLLYSIEETMYVSAYNADEAAVCTWTVDNGNRLHSLGANDYVVDMIPITNGAGSLLHLATLSQSRIRIHQVTPSG